MQASRNPCSALLVTVFANHLNLAGAPHLGQLYPGVDSNFKADRQPPPPRIQFGAKTGNQRTCCKQGHSLPARAEIKATIRSGTKWLCLRAICSERHTDGVCFVSAQQFLTRQSLGKLDAWQSLHGAVAPKDRRVRLFDYEVSLLLADVLRPAAKRHDPTGQVTGKRSCELACWPSSPARSTYCLHAELKHAA